MSWEGSGRGVTASSLPERDTSLVTCSAPGHPGKACGSSAGSTPATPARPCSLCWGWLGCAAPLDALCSAKMLSGDCAPVGWCGMDTE